MMIKAIMFAGLIMALSACQEEIAPSAPKPTLMTQDAVGYFCQMQLIEHDGPKAQIQLANNEKPLWFSQIRDAVAFTKMPEETAEITAFYVNDMSKAVSWQQPGFDNWIDANAAFFVIDSKITGGMGAPEAVPFGSMDSAEIFVNKNGGEIVRLDKIPDEYVLAPVDVMPVVSTEHDHEEGKSH